MSQYSDFVGRTFVVLAFVLVLLFIFGYYNHSEEVLIVTIVLAIVVTFFSLAVIILIDSDRYDLFWRKPWIPLIAVVLMDFLLWIIRKQFVEAIFNKVQEPIVKPLLPFGNLLQALPPIPLSHFVGLIIIFLYSPFLRAIIFVKIARRTLSNFKSTP